MTPTGVSLSDGALTFSDTDLAIGGLEFQRIHQGGRMDPRSQPFGPRMTHNYDIYVKRNNRTDCSGGPGTCVNYNRPVVHLGQGASISYIDAGNANSYIYSDTDDGLRADLKRDSSGAYVYTDSEGTVYTFSSVTASTTNVESIVFPNGRRQDFIAGSSSRIVLDSSGYALVMIYGSNGKISTVCGYNRAVTYVSSATTCAGATLKASYGYGSGSEPFLTSVTDPRGGVTTYDYTSDISCIKPPGYTSCKIANVYGSGTLWNWQVVQQTLNDGSVWNYAYYGDYSKPRNPELTVLEDPSNWTVVTDPAGKASTYTFVSSSPYSATDATGQVTQYRYRGGYDINRNPDGSQNQGSSLVEVEFPEHNKYLAEYYAPRRSVSKVTQQAKPGSGLADRVIQYGYQVGCDTPPATLQNCAKPLWKKEPSGAQTDYTYATWGGLLSEMKPAPASGAARPLKLYTYVQKYAYVRNASGALVAAASAIWLPATETVCQTAANSSVASCDTGAQITVTTYEYAPDGTADNLLPRGKAVSADGITLRTCYGYDWMGNKIWERQPRAGVSVCS